MGTDPQAGILENGTQPYSPFISHVTLCVKYNFLNDPEHIVWNTTHVGHN